MKLRCYFIFNSMVADKYTAKTFLALPFVYYYYYYITGLRQRGEQIQNKVNDENPIFYLFLA